MCLYDTHDVGLPTQFLFNGVPESQPIAGLMLVNCVQRWLNIAPTLTERMILLHQRLYSNHWTANQCCFNVDPMCLTIAQQQPSIRSVYIGYFAAIAIGMTISTPVAIKATT